MNYQKIYNQLIEKRKKEIPEGYKENHHVIPRCMGGDDNAENMVYLSAREHFVAHWLLAKIYNNTRVGYKLASAFQLMTRNQNHTERHKCGQRKYDIARKLFSQNHPCKTDEIKNKIRVTMIKNGHARSIQQILEEKELKQKLKEERTQTKIKRREDVLQQKELKKLKKLQEKLKKQEAANKNEERICQCGCNRTFLTKASSQKKLFSLKCYVTDEHKKKLSKIATEYLSQLTPGQLQERSKKQSGTADHVARGKKISAQKKGKKTNQQLIETEKYGKMSQQDFDEFIKDRNPKIRTRMINKRNAYNGNDSNRVSLFED